MADLADVLTALKAAIVGAIYPGAQVAGQAVTGFDVEIGIGWPDDTELETGLKAGLAFVSIYPLDGERNTTNREYTDTPVPRGSPGITVNFNADTYTATLSGVAVAGDAVGVVYNNIAYYFALTAGQTSLQEAVAIAAALPGGSVSTVLSALVFTPNASCNVLVSNNGLSQQYLGTIERRVQLTVWAYDQASRDKLFAVLQQLIMRNRFLLVPIANSSETEQVSIVFSSSVWTDKAQNAGAYMRGLVVLVAFDITSYTAAYAILFTGGTINQIQHFGPNLAGDTPTGTITYNGVPVVFNGVPITFNE